MDEKRDVFISLTGKKSRFLSINTLIKFLPALPSILHSPYCILPSASEDVGNFMILHHLSRNKPVLGSDSLWLCFVWDGQGQPRAPADFGDVMEISEPSYHTLPNSSLSLGKLFPVR